ncbi:MAG: hypothetical protein IJA85_01375, partial [Clostridia bacterium]|nr:hypothetical protein [Clostridia bacterium]
RILQYHPGEQLQPARTAAGEDADRRHGWYVCVKFWVFFDCTVIDNSNCRNVQKHQSYIESAPKHIHEIFTSDIGNCAHCAVGGSVKTDGSCSHRKAYTIHGTQYAKCDGKVFYVPDFSRYPVEDLVSLIRQIYPQKG